MRATVNNKGRVSWPVMVGLAMAAAGLGFALQCVARPVGQCAVGPAYGLTAAQPAGTRTGR
jgi:hypothetical protein